MVVCKTGGSPEFGGELRGPEGGKRGRPRFAGPRLHPDLTSLLPDPTTSRQESTPTPRLDLSQLEGLSLPQYWLIFSSNGTSEWSKSFESTAESELPCPTNDEFTLAGMSSSAPDTPGRRATVAKSNIAKNSPHRFNSASLARVRFAGRSKRSVPMVQDVHRQKLAYQSSIPPSFRPRSGLAQGLFGRDKAHGAITLLQQYTISSFHLTIEIILWL